MRRAYQLTGLVLFAIAGVAGYESHKLQYYTPLGPGPGFFPVWLSVLLGLLALAMIVQATSGRSEPLPPDFVASRSSYWRMAAVIASLAAMAAAVTTLGYPLATFLFYLVLLTVLGRRSVAETVILAGIGGFGVYYVFTRLLGTALPSGILGL